VKSHEHSVEIKSCLSADKPKRVQLSYELGTLPINLTTSNGIAVQATIDVQPRDRVFLDDLHCFGYRDGPAGTTEPLIRFFAVQDPGLETFAPGWVAGIPWGLGSERPLAEGCLFEVDESGYRIAMIVGDNDGDRIVSFCEDPMQIGFGECEGELYVSLRTEVGISGLARFDARSMIDRERQLPRADLAHGNGLLLELIDASDGIANAVRFVRLPTDFMAELRRRLVDHIARGPRGSMATSQVTGIGVCEHCVDGIVSEGMEEVGADCPVFGAWVPQATAFALYNCDLVEPRTPRDTTH
jgi:hypothetical protein